MKYLVAILALAMPLIGWLSNSGLIGPSNGEISDRYPTLIVAAGYAFAIWGPIFLLDVVFGLRQAMVEGDARLRVIRVLSAAGFALTSAWMLVFPVEWFGLALAIIWASLACMLGAAWLASHTDGHARGPWWQWVPLSLHAGWVSLAVFLNTAQVIVAHGLLSTSQMLPWTLVLFAGAALLVLTVVVRLKGNPWYAAAAVWGLVGVYAKQSESALAGASVAAYVALALAGLVAAVALAAWMRARRSPVPVRLSAG